MLTPYSRHLNTISQRYAFQGLGQQQIQDQEPKTCVYSGGTRICREERMM